ncbi:GumC family protein [Arcticibacter sp. MXS-1]|uniref:GumC family protein n=1 Tax=Arcticibacter sp. MXS-1 TaxID=3341726 RepID=UPI0035A994CD
MNTTTTQVPGAVLEENDEFDLRGLIYKYVHHWRWFLFSILFFLALGFIYIQFQKPSYRIEGKLLIKNNDKAGAADAASKLNDLDLFSSDKVIDNEIEIIKTKSLLERTVKNLNLQVNLYAKDGLRYIDLYGKAPIKVEMVKENAETFADYIEIEVVSASQVRIDKKAYPYNKIVSTPYGSFVIRPDTRLSQYTGATVYLKVNDLEGAIQQYSDNLKVEAGSGKSSVLSLSISDEVPQRGKDFINNLIEGYNLDAIDDKNRLTATSLKFIEDRLNVIASELSGVERNVEAYKSSNQITDISSQSKLFLESLQQNDLELNKVLIQLNVLEQIEKYVSNGEGGAKLPSTMGLEDPTLLGQVKQLSEALNRRESLLSTIPETNPIIQSIDAQVESLKKSIFAGVQNIKSALTITRDRLKSKSSQFETVIRRVPTKERGLLDIMRQQEIKNNLFIYLLEKREETALVLASNVADTRVIDAPRSGRFPESPKKKVIYIVFFALGIFLPILIIFLRDLMGYKVSTRAEIEKLTNAPILADVAYSADRTVLSTIEKPRSIISEQIRALRTNLRFTSGGKDRQTILFTSNISGEGKSFISLNLGSSLVASGKKVVILELDLRKPKLHLNLGMDNSLGLSNYLIGQAPYDQIVKEIPQQKGYYIITSGPLPPNPAELLTKPSLRSLIERLKDEFDYVLLDAPPVGLVTDAQIIADLADSTIFIVRHNYSEKRGLQYIERLYKDRKFNNLNLVFNAVDMKTSHGYGYSSGEGYGYYADSKRNKSWIRRIFG